MKAQKYTKEQARVIQELNKLISAFSLQGKLSPEMVIDWVWKAHGGSAMEASNAYHKQCFRFFRNVEDIDEINRILQIFVDVWNFFPHRDLDGKSPDQLMREFRGIENKGKAPQGGKDQAMPKIICGGREFSWDEYWAMAKECERAQKPFRNWIEKQVMPAYLAHLVERYRGERTIKSHERVADIFFKRALHLGFVNFGELHSRFVWDEFPAWWQTHVLDDYRSEDQIRSSLEKLSYFLHLHFGRPLPVRIQ